MFITGAGQSCVAENDTVWGMQWQQTSVEVTAVQKCPGLAESAGKLLFALANSYSIISTHSYLMLILSTKLVKASQQNPSPKPSIHLALNTFIFS